MITRTISLIAFLYTTSECLAAQPRGLVLRSRNLTHIPPTTCRKCQTVDLSDNAIGLIADDDFVAYPSTIKYLYLRDNSITTISAHAFARLSSVVLLDLASNNITHIASTTRFPPSLKRLTLARNPLTTATFVSETLRSIDLSFCRFQTLALEVFSELPNLDSIDLNHNALHSLDVKVVDALSRIGEVFLEENPWRCDCLMYNLTNKTEEEDDDMRCVTEMGDTIPWSQLRCSVVVKTTAVQMPSEASTSESTAMLITWTPGGLLKGDTSRTEAMDVVMYLLDSMMVLIVVVLLAVVAHLLLREKQRAKQRRNNACKSDDHYATIM